MALRVGAEEVPVGWNDIVIAVETEKLPCCDYLQRSQIWRLRRGWVGAVMTGRRAVGGVGHFKN